MREIVSVRFKSGGKSYYFDPKGVEIAPGQGVIVETSRGVEYGECTQGNSQVEDQSVSEPLRPVVRLATAEDLKIVEENKARAKKAFAICQEKIQEHKLEMKLVDVEYGFERSKLLFFFTSEGRVDFRDLVKDLAGIFRMRIELRQIGVRDEAKMLGGLGICGQPFCCSTFLEEFQPVSIKMAKTQNLSLNPTKISGTCGRLMCCLKYEQEAYEDLVKRVPKPDTLVETPDGVGSVTGINLLREQVKVRFDDQGDNSIHCYKACEVCSIRGAGGKPVKAPPPPPREERSEQPQGRLRRDSLKRAEPKGDKAPEKEVSAAPVERPEPKAPQHHEKHTEKRHDEVPQRTRQPGFQPPPEPGAEAAGDKPAEKSGSSRRRRNRHRGGGHSGEQAPQDKGQQPAQPRQPKPQQEAAQPAGQGGEKSGESAEKRRRRRRRKPRGAGGSGEGKPAEN